MAQHDMNIANQGFPATRADLNNALQALVSNSSGATEPSTTFANQWWYDTTNNKMYIRNEANNAWIEVFTLDQTSNEWQLTTGVIQAKDSDGLALKTDDGTTRLFINDSDGAVGIGTSSPSANLHVSSGTSGDAVVLIEADTDNNDEDDTPILRLSQDGGATISDIGIEGTAGTLFTDSLANATYITTTGNTPLQFATNDSARMTIMNTTGNVGIGTSSPSANLHVSGSGAQKIDVTDTGGPSTRLSVSGSSAFLGTTTNHSQLFITNDTERARIDSSGNLRVGNTTGTIYTSSSNTGVIASTSLQVATSGSTVGFFNRQSTDGQILGFYKNGSQVGTITTKDSDLVIGTGDTGFRFIDGSEAIIPQNTSTNSGRDNAIDLGNSGARFDDIYATNGTIQTSDQNEKQQIVSLTDAEITAAKAISKLFKTFKWNDSVAENGDNARTHTGVIAQQVETAMSDAGLDAGNYAFFISTTWWETQTEVAAVEAVAEELDEDGNVVTEAVEAQDAYTRTDTYNTLEEAPEGATERNRKGIRYPELLSFIGAATEQRLTSIEARLDALEG
jgi:hypothetical protein